MSAVNRISPAGLKGSARATDGHASAVADSAAAINGDAATASAPKEGRDEHGRFAKGNAGGPGNPYARRTADLRRAILAAVTTEAIEAIADKLIEQAKDGDVPSAKLLFSYALGKPAEAVEPDAIDFHEWELFCRQPVRAAQIEMITGNMPVAMIGELMRYVLPCVAANSRSKFLAMMKAQDEAGEGRPPVGVAAGSETRAERVPAGAAPSAKGAKGEATAETGGLTSPARQRATSPAPPSPSGTGGNGSTAPAKRPSRAARILTSGLRKTLGR